MGEDLGILQELSTCDYLGVPGMAVASEQHCLQLRGGISYQLEIGNFREEAVIARTSHDTKLPVGRYGADWNTQTNSWLRMSDFSETDYGPARAVFTVRSEEEHKYWGSSVGYTTEGATASTRGTNDLKLDEAYVELGDQTKFMAGKKGSVAVFGDDRPFNYLSLFNTSSYEGGGVGIDNDSEQIGGQVAHFTSRLNDNWTVAGGLEALGSVSGGTAVASVAYAREGFSSHFTGLVFDITRGDKSWMLHSGASAYFDGFSLRSASAYHANANQDGIDRLDAMISAEARYKIFTLAMSSELIRYTNVAAGDYTDHGFGASIGFPLHKYVSGNLGSRIFIDGRNGLWTGQFGGQVNATMSEVFSVGAEAGLYFGSKLAEQQAAGKLENALVGYASGYVNVTPGGGVTGLLKGEVNSERALKLTVRAAKEFK